MSLRGLQSILGIGLAGVLFVAVILLSNTWLQGYRLDLTTDRLYSISDETRSILDGIEEPITLTLYFSHEAAEGVPYVREYARRVRELLEAYAAHSDGRIRLRQADPRPLTDARERVEELGLEAVPAGDGKEIYLGLAGTNQLDGLEVIEFFEPERERFLEYDLSRLVWSLRNPDRPQVGLLTRLPMGERVDPATGRRQPRWAVLDRVEDIADIRDLDHPQHDIDDDIDVLLVSHPRRYGDATLYAIDQFLMRGGHVLMFVDPVADSDSGQRERDGSIETRISSSDPGPLLAGWGIDVDLDHALADPRSGMVVSSGSEGSRDIHPGLMRIERDGLVDDDPVTAMIEQLVVASAGSIRPGSDGPTLRPLLRSSETAAPVAVRHFVGFDSPWEITRGYRPDGERHILGGRFSGRIASAYPDGRPEESRADPDAHRSGVEDGHLVLFADTDLLTDRLWIRSQPVDGRMVRAPFAGNGDLVANAVENLAGGEALLGLRARGTSARPFTRMRELERAAAERHRETQNELRTELEETERLVQSLQAGAPEGAGDAILSEDQRAELAEARQRRAELRGEVRRVQERLDAEINALEARLKLLNIVAVPLLITAGAVAMFRFRRRRQRRHRQAPG